MLRAALGVICSNCSVSNNSGFLKNMFLVCLFACLGGFGGLFIPGLEEASYPQDCFPEDWQLRGGFLIKKNAK